MIDRIIAGVLAVKAKSIADSVLAKGSNLQAKRIIRACNVVLQAIEDERHSDEALFRQARLPARPPRPHS